MLFTHIEYQPWSQATGSFWYVLATGVQLFFTLSGFLLFRPYAARHADWQAPALLRPLL